jgi:hypothetical protein
MAKTSVSQWDLNPDLNTDINGINIAEQCPPAGINNALRALMAQIAALPALVVATAIEFLTGTANNRIVTPKTIFDATAFVTIADAATITPNLNAGINFAVTLGGNRTIANPTGLKPGQSGFIELKQDATGLRTVTWGSYYDFGVVGYPILSTGPNKVDVFSYYVRSPTSVRIFAAKGFS